MHLQQLLDRPFKLFLCDVIHTHTRPNPRNERNPLCAMPMLHGVLQALHQHLDDVCVCVCVCVDVGDHGGEADRLHGTENAVAVRGGAEATAAGENH